MYIIMTMTVDKNAVKNRHVLYVNTAVAAGAQWIASLTMTAKLKTSLTFNFAYFASDAL